MKRKWEKEELACGTFTRISQKALNPAANLLRKHFALSCSCSRSGRVWNFLENQSGTAVKNTFNIPFNIYKTHETEADDEAHGSTHSHTHTHRQFAVLAPKRLNTQILTHTYTRPIQSTTKMETETEPKTTTMMMLITIIIIIFSIRMKKTHESNRNDDDAEKTIVAHHEHSGSLISLCVQKCCEHRHTFPPMALAVVSVQMAVVTSKIRIVTMRR